MADLVVAAPGEGAAPWPAGAHGDPAGFVEVFEVDGGACPPRLLELLDGAELERHPRAVRRGRPGYGAGRAALRLYLGAQLGLAPERVAFARRCESCGRAGHGKPAAVGAPPRELDFSVATTGDVTLIAVAHHGRVGVDVERVPLGERLFWPRPCFAPRERQQLGRLGPRRRPEAAVRSWVRKEAVAKWAGMGLGMPLAGVEVTGAPADWRLPHPSVQVVDLELARGLVAAIALDRRAGLSVVSEWRWSR